MCFIISLVIYTFLLFQCFSNGLAKFGILKKQIVVGKSIPNSLSIEDELQLIVHTG